MEIQSYLKVWQQTLAHWELFALHVRLEFNVALAREVHLEKGKARLG
jgi:hypothetical protein